MADPSGPVRSSCRTEITRGAHVESVHSAVAVAIPTGGSPIHFGDSELVTCLRSVAKPFQTLALFRSGVPDAKAFTAEELAVVTASHAGERYHHELVASLLARCDLSPDDLRCGIHPPFSGVERRRRLASGEPLSVLGNNCSGKHTGMLIHARHLGAELATYLEPDHPVQGRVREVLETFLGERLLDSQLAVDGCGAPTYHVRLTAMARAFARLIDREFVADQGLASAADRLHASIEQQPRAFSGEGRIPYLVRELLGRGFWSKEGAEGVYVVWGERGVLVIKSLDGSERGYRYLLPALLRELEWIDASTHARWREREKPVVRNVVGRVVGEIRPVLG